MEAKSLPMISIILPVKPGGYVKAIESVRQLNYPADRLEVFIAEGTQPSRQRNCAAEKSKGDILYFLDDDSCPDRDNLKRLAEHFSDEAVAVVGGPSLTPESDSFLQHCFGAVFASPFGGAGIRNRYRKTGKVRETSEKELILCNLSFRSEVYMEFGGLNEKLYPNEENELMDRIKAGGGILLHDPDLVVFRSQRKDIPAFLKQVFNYGRGRMEQTFINPSPSSFLHMIPLVFLLYAVTLFFVSSVVYYLPIIFYFLLAVFFAIKGSGATGNENNLWRWMQWPPLSAFFLCLHLAYGAGMIWGLFRSFRISGQGGCEPVVREVKL